MAAPSRRAREALGERLRDLRRSAGLSGGQLAAQLGEGWGQSKVSRIETGRQLPSDSDVRQWAAAFGDQPEELVAMLGRATAEYAAFRDRYVQAGGADQAEDAITAADFQAHQIGHYQPGVIIDYLQTPDYARAVLHLADGPAAHGATEDEISRKIAARLRRQAIIYEPGRQITLVVGEAALRSRVAPPAVMAAQCEHIARIAESLTTTTIGIVPFSAQMPVFGITGWVIVDDLVSIETEGGELEIADPQEVERYWQYLKALLEVSVTGAKAALLCRQAADAYRTPITR